MVRCDNLKELEDYLISLGFHKYTPPPFDKYNYTAGTFQKAYKDEIGKKYFIDATIWDWTFTDKIPEKYTLEYNGQYYQKDTHDAVNMEFIGWEIESVEAWLNKMFECGLLEYYEEWE